MRMSGHGATRVMAGSLAECRGIDIRSGQQAGDEGEIGKTPLLAEHFAHDPADAGNTAVKKKQHNTGKTEQHAAEKRGPVGAHRVSSSGAQNMV